MQQGRVVAAQPSTVARPRSLRASGTPRGNLKSLIRLSGYLRPHWRLVVPAYLSWLVTVGADAMIPLAVRRAVDEGIAQQDSSVLATSVLAILAFYVVKSVFHYGFVFFFHYYEAAAARSIRNAMYAALQRLSFSFFDRVETGQLISRSISDVEAAQMFLGHGFSALLNTVGTYAIVLTIAFTLNWQLTLLSMVALPVLLIVAAYFGKEMRALFAQVQQQHGVLTGVLQENLAGIRVVKAFARENHEIEKFEAAADNLLNRQREMVRVLALRLPTMMLISGIGTVFVIWYGGRLAIDGVITVGTLIAFNYYLVRLMAPTRRIGWIINQMARAIASADRIFEVMDAAPEVRDRPGAVELREVRGEIRFEDVWFGYDSERPVLKGIDLEVKAGEVIGVVGATGSGKSALVGLIPRFYDVTRGRVMLDGVDIRDITLESLRKSVSVVQQDSFLFSRSLRENIAFGHPEARIEEVQGAADHAQVEHFASRLPAGYETLVGDRGLSLSGGQRQRTTLARAFLVEPRILILDDAVSSIDVETERRIKESLQKISRGQTILIIAHRLSTVREADRIIVLDEGRIVESGSHDELLKIDGRYAQLHRMQQQAAAD